MGEFYVAWVKWLRSPEVASIPFTALEESLRGCNLDELVLVKTQVSMCL